jgi:putative tricarboxylic transport membrane protein
MMFVLNVDIIYGLFIGLIVSSVFLFIIGSVAIRGFRFVADVPKRILMPAVLVLCVYGVFAVNNNIFDVGVMFVMGWVGYLMMRAHVPAAPFLIAFILGPLLEDNFRQSMLMSGSDPSILFRGPITWFFWLLTVVTIIAIVRGARRASKVAKELRG